MDSTNSTDREQTPWQKSMEALDRIEAAGLLDGAPVTTVSIYGSGGLAVHLRGRDHAETIAAHFEMGDPVLDATGRGVTLRWSAVVAHGVRLDLYGFVPVDINVMLNAASAVAS